MLSIDDEEFSELISQAMGTLPQQWIEKLDNVAVTFADEPTTEQLQKLRTKQHQSLFGLYEGVPRTSRGSGYNLVLPDKITIFKYPMTFMSADKDELREQIRHTLWHEIAHHFGLNHDQIKDKEH